MSPIGYADSIQSGLIRLNHFYDPTTEFMHMTVNGKSTHKTKPNAARASIADYLKAARGVVQPDDLRDIIAGICRKAKEGDLDAARLLLDRFLPREFISERLRAESAELDSQERAKTDPTEAFRRHLQGKL